MFKIKKILSLRKQDNKLQVLIENNCVLNVSTKPIINSKPQQSLEVMLADKDIVLLKPNAHARPVAGSLEYLKGDVNAEKVFIPKPEQYYKDVKGTIWLGNKQGINYYFAPPAQIFCLKTKKGFLGVGLGDVYNINGVTMDLRKGFSLNFNQFYGNMPEIILVGGKTEWNVLSKYGRFLQKSNRVKKPKPIEWHKGAIYCTWVDQIMDTSIGNMIINMLNIYTKLTSRFEGFFEKFKQVHASQNMNIGFGKMFSEKLNHQRVVNSVKKIEKKGLLVKTIILDDGWMEYNGEPQAHPKRFPYIAKTNKYLHSKKFKVLAWYPVWWIHPESKTAEKHPDWIVKDARGKLTYKFNTKKQEVKKYIRNMIYKIINEHGFDGLKLDFGYDSPPGFGDRDALELQKLIYETAQDAKPDALVIGISPNPFFAQYSNMIRLNDNFSHDISSQMMRAVIAKKLCPGYLIDSDGYYYSDNIVNYHKHLSKLCVPSFYHLRITEQQEEELKAILKDYKQSCKK